MPVEIGRMSKEVETIIAEHPDTEPGTCEQSLARDIARSVLLLAAKKMCPRCQMGIPLTKNADGHWLGGTKLTCYAAPIHQLLNGGDKEA